MNRITHCAFIRTAATVPTYYLPPAFTGRPPFPPLPSSSLPSIFSSSSLFPSSIHPIQFGERRWVFISLVSSDLLYYSLPASLTPKSPERPKKVTPHTHSSPIACYHPLPRPPSRTAVAIPLDKTTSVYHIIPFFCRPPAEEWV